MENASIDNAAAEDASVEEASAAAESMDVDAILAREIAQGDADALDALISRYWASLTRYASRILDDMALAEDAVQTVFIRVWEGRGWPPGRVRPFLFRATRNVALDVLRSRDARHDRERTVAEEADRDVPTPADTVRSRRITTAVDAAIQQLPERRREAFTLAYLQGLSYKEAGAVLGISPKTVGNHVTAALATLRKRLRPLLTDDPASEA